MHKKMNPTGTKLLCMALCCVTTLTSGFGEVNTWFYNPDEDPIPYNPENNQFGPAYEIPASAAWKIEADKRIDTHRKANLSVGVMNQQGVRLANVPVHVELMRHDFMWGAVVNADFLDGEHNEILKSYFLKYFNSGGVENGLKPKQCILGDIDNPGIGRIFRSAEKQIEWFEDHDIPARGHLLAWEGESWLSREMRQIYENPNLSDLEKGERMFEHNAKRLDLAVEKWKVFCWDVVNEPRANHLIKDLLSESGKDSLVEWFRLADIARKKYNRDTKLYYNENQIASYVRRRGSFDQHRDIYRARLQEVLDAGVPLDGIGFQYRFRGYVEPEEVYRRLSAFDDFNLPYHATEFEVKPMAQGGRPFTTDQKKKITAEVITQFFSHPNATGFWHWTFMERRRGGSPHALFSYDGEPRPEAEQWIKMLEEDFNTDETVETEENGIATVRGFKGIYKVIVGTGPAAKTSIIELTEDTALKVIL